MGADEPLWVYGVVDGAESFLPSLRPVAPAASGDIELVSSGPIAAVTSRLESPQVRPIRSNLAAHIDIVDAFVAAGSTLLPIRFGTVASSATDLVATMLRPYHRQLTNLLHRFEDKIEVRVEVRRTGDSALYEAIDAEPRIRRLRDKIRRQPPAASYYDQVALGRLVHETIEALDARDSRHIAGTLSVLAEEARYLGGEGEPVVFRGAFLLHRKQLQHFESALSRMAEQQSARLNFRLTGPLALWDFVEMPQQGPTRRRPAPAGVA